VHLYRGLQRGAGVRVDLTVQRNFFELWCGPLHGLCPLENNTKPVLLSLNYVAVEIQAREVPKL
jgi:hypothetical protein